MLAVGLAPAPIAQAQQAVPAANELVNFEVTGWDDCELDVRMTNPTNAQHRMDFLMPGQVLQSIDGSYPRGSDVPVALPAGAPEEEWQPGGVGTAFKTFPNEPRITEGTIDVGEAITGASEDEVTIMVRLRRGPSSLHIHHVARDFNPFTVTGCAREAEETEETGVLGSLSGSLGTLFGS